MKPNLYERQGELRLPQMQRRYVWRSTRVRDLLESLYRRPLRTLEEISADILAIEQEAEGLLNGLPTGGQKK